MPPEKPARAALPDSIAQLCAALDPARTATAHLLPALRALDWAASLPNSAAPGFVCLAGALAGQSVGGGGRDLPEAAARLAGEAAEVLAQTAPPESPAETCAADREIDAIWTAAPAPTRASAQDLTRGRPVAVPACAIHLGPAFDAERAPQSPPRSLGLAAGPDQDAARLAALLELIERDAAAGWWCEGIPPRVLDTETAAAAAADLAAMRGGASAQPRATTLLALDSPTGLPVVCALSRDRDGGGLVIGLKAALCPGLAAAGAVIEMLQMEFGLELARRRQALGQATMGDTGALARAALDPDSFTLLPARPLTPPPLTGFAGLVAHLESLGQRIILADLAPRGGLAIAKVFAPGLRPMPGGAISPRPEDPGFRADLM